MKKKNFILYVAYCIYAAALISCNPKPKDSLAKADSANRSNIDTALKYKDIVIDEGSADFMVRFSNTVVAEREIASLAMHAGVDNSIKDFAATLYHELTGLFDSIQSLRIRKKIVLPTVVSTERQAEIEVMKKARGARLDKGFIDYVIKTHEHAEAFFKTSMLEAKDEDIRAFADISSIIFKKYLNMARALRK